VNHPPAIRPASRRRPRRHSHGQATFEFAFAGVVFLVLLFTIMEMALAVLAYNSISFAVSEAVRYGSALPATATDLAPAAQNTAAGTSAVQAVAEAAASSVSLTAADIVVTWPSDSLYTGGTDVAITITYDFSLAIPRLPWQSLATHPASISLPLTVTAQMLCSQMPTT
jgi:Flp pilus assembly protein TadG